MDMIITDVLASLIKGLSFKISTTEKVTESKDLSLIDAEAKRQAIELQMAHAQAKVAQEVAIAQRIEYADEVIIEEYYEGEAKGKVGITGDEKGMTVGVSGEGRRVTKRVYRFIGNAQKTGK